MEAAVNDEPVNGGEIYVVGEKGPELFVALGNGRIVPTPEDQ